MRKQSFKACGAALAGIVMAAGLLTGCGNGGGTNETSQPAQGSGTSQADAAGDSAQESGAEGTDTEDGGQEGELIPISFARTTDASIESNIFAQIDASWEDNLWNDLYADEVGVQVVYKWVATDGDQGKQKLNGAIASGDIPDVCQVDKTTMKQMADAGLIVDIAPYFEQYASDRLKKLIEDAGPQCIEAATFDGVQYGFPFVDCDIETADMLWIRQDWLDKANLEAPKSIDELEAVMKAFGDIAGDGAVGMRIGNTANIPGFFHGYGVYPGYWTVAEDGKLQYDKATADMKEPLAKLAQWYQEGLLDKEFYVKDDAASIEPLVAGKCGVVYAWHAYGLYPLQDSASADPEADWRPFSIIPSAEGALVEPGIRMATSSWYVVSAKCEHPEKFIEMLNLYCEKSFGDDTAEYAKYINPGGDMEGLWRLSPVSLNTPNKNQITTGKVIAAMTDGSTEGMNGEETNMYNYCKANLDGDRSLWGWNIEFNEGGSQTVLIGYQVAGNLVYDEFYGAPTDTMTSKSGTLEAMLDEAIVKIVSGQMSVDEYDSVIESWKAAGGEQIIQEVNDWYQTR